MAMWCMYMGMCMDMGMCMGMIMMMSMEVFQYAEHGDGHEYGHNNMPGLGIELGVGPFPGNGHVVVIMRLV